MISLSWPGSTCKLKNCTYMGKTDYFSLHGLWPEYAQDCGQVHFSEADLSPENQKDVPVYWSSMYNSEMWFINHELSKHGSCWKPSRSNPDKCPSAIASVLRSVSKKEPLKQKLNDFIRLAVAWAKTHDLFEILKNHGMSPSDDDVLDPAAMMRALSQNFGVANAAFPVCRGRRHEMYLSEVRFCLNDNFQVISCGARIVHNHLQSCGGDVNYPLFPVLD